MDDFTWTMLTVLITAAAINQGSEAIGRILQWVGQLLAANWHDDGGN